MKSRWIRSAVLLPSLLLGCASAPPPAAEPAPAVDTMAPEPELPAAPEPAPTAEDAEEAGEPAAEPAPPAGAAPCDAEAVKKGKEALAVAKTTPDRKSALATRVLVESCDTGFSKSLDAVDSFSPDQRAVIISKAVSENIADWNAACAGGIDIFTKMSAMAPAKRGPMLNESCEIEKRHGFANAQEIAKADAGALLIAIVYAGLLEKSGIDEKDSRPVLRGVLGL